MRLETRWAATGLKNNATATTEIQLVRLQEEPVRHQERERKPRIGRTDAARDEVVHQPLECAGLDPSLRIVCCEKSHKWCQFSAVWSRLEPIPRPTGRRRQTRSSRPEGRRMQVYRRPLEHLGF